MSRVFAGSASFLTRVGLPEEAVAAGCAVGDRVEHVHQAAAGCTRCSRGPGRRTPWRRTGSSTTCVAAAHGRDRATARPAPSAAGEAPAAAVTRGDGAASGQRVSASRMRTSMGQATSIDRSGVDPMRVNGTMASRAWPAGQPAAVQWRRARAAAVGRRGGSRARGPGHHRHRVPRRRSALGVVDAHDHLLIDSPGHAGPGLHGRRALDPRRPATALASGIATLVEMTPIGLGRDPAGMRAIGEATGLAVIAASGLPPRRPLPRRAQWVHDATVETLARPDRHGPHRRDAPGRLARPVAAARRGEGRRDQGRRLVPPHQPRGTAPARGDRGRRPPRPARRSSSTPRSGPPRHEIVDLLESAGRDDRPDRARPPRPQPGLGAPRRGRRARRDARVRHGRPDEVPPRQRRPRPHRAGRRRRVTSTGSCSASTSAPRDYLRAYDGGPGMRYLMTTFVPRLRRRVGDDADGADPGRQPGPAVRHPGAAPS